MGYDTSRGPPIVSLVPARSALALSGPARTVSHCPAATRTACPSRVAPCCSPHVAPCCPAHRALLQPACRALLPCASRPTAANASRPAAAIASRPPAASASRPAVASASRSDTIQLAASCSCRKISHQTLLWHHRLGHPSLPRLRSMHSRLLVSGFPKSLPSLPRPPALPCLPCVEGRQRAALHSSEFPPTTAPLQTLHLDVWGPAHVGGTDQDRYFLLVVEDYTRYTTVFSLRRKADVSGVLIPRIHATRRQLRDRFSEDFPVLRLHSDRGSEFSSDLLAEFYRDEGIVHSFTLPSSPQQNEIPERRIGLVMEVARTSMIHAAAPYFLWPFAVRYAAHQLNLWPRVSEPETSPTLRWMGKVGDASVFRVWGALSLVRDPKASKLSSRTLRCVLLGFPTDAPSWQFHYPRERRVFSSQDVTFDESVCFYRLHPHASHPARGSSTTRASVESSPPSGLLTTQLCELFLRGASGGSCLYVIRTGDRAGQTCGRLHTQHRCFSHLDDAWRAEFGDDVELPRWADLLKSRIAIFDLDLDAILSAMYALSVSAEGDCYRCVPPDPGIAAAALGASESGTLPGTAPTEALHTFMLDSGTSRCFFRDSTNLTPLPAPVPVRLADPSGGPVMARFSTVLPCPAVAASCSCRLLLHHTLLWHHRLGHPSLPHLRGMHSRLLVFGLPRSLPPIPPLPAPPCLPCVKGRQRAAPHSSSFPPTTSPLQTLHMDVRGPARVSGQSRERYFLLVVDDYTRYTTVFPLRSKGQVVDVLIPWIRSVRLQLRERFGQDLPVLHLHSDRGGEFSSTRLREFCRGEGILQSFTLPDSPQQNGIVERRIGLVMEVARTSMIHAAAPHFLWPFAGPAPLGVSQVDPLPGPAPVQVAVDSGTALGAASGGAEPGGAESEGAETGGAELGGVATGGGEPGGAEPEGVEPGVAATEGAESKGAEPQGAASSGGFAGASPSLSPKQSDRARAARCTVSRLLATGVTDPSFESAAASSLVAELLEFAAACRLDYAIALVAESASASPPSIGGECVLGTDVLEDRQEDFESLPAAVPRFASMLLAPEGDPDAPDIPTRRSYAEAITGTYLNEVPPPGANIVDGMWIFRVKRPSGSPPAFKVRYIARGFSQRQGVDYFQTFSPTSKMTTLRVLLYVTAQRDYELHSLDFSTACLQGSLHEEIWLRRPLGFSESFPAGTQWSLWRPVYGLRQAPREWHDTLRTTLAALGFAPSSADPSLFLRTDT
ncbi:unnamed protein product [Closterium sp. NIES-54]